jgi:FlgD Ig-like domain
MQAGDNKLEWEGLSKDGKKLSNGAYTFSIAATDRNNQPIPSNITSTLQVTGVDLHDTGGAFYTPIGKVGVRDVASVGTSAAHNDQAHRPATKKPEATPSAKSDEVSKESAPPVAAAKPLMEMPVNLGAKASVSEKYPTEKASDKTKDKGIDKAPMKKEA